MIVSRLPRFLTLRPRHKKRVLADGGAVINGTVHDTAIACGPHSYFRNSGDSNPPPLSLYGCNTPLLKMTAKLTKIYLWGDVRRWWAANFRGTLIKLCNNSLNQ